MNTARLAESISDEAAAISKITTNKRHSKVDAKTMAQIWRTRLGPVNQTLKTITQVEIRHAFHPFNRRYNMDIIHGYSAWCLRLVPSPDEQNN